MNMQQTTVSSVAQQRKLRVKEEERAMEEIKRRQREKTYDMQARLQEESLLNLEMETHTKLFNLIQNRRKEESGRALRVQIEQSSKEQELNKALQNQVWRVEDEQQRLRLTKMRQEKVKALEDGQDEAQRRRILSELRIKNLESHIGMSGVARERALRKIEAEFEIKEDIAAQLRRQTAELRIDADRRDQEAAINETQRKTNIEVGPIRKLMEEEVHKYSVEAEAEEAEFLQQREEIVKKLFDEQLQRTEQSMEEIQEKEDINMRRFLKRMENSRLEAREEEEQLELQEHNRRDHEMRILIAKHEAELADLEEAFSPKKGWDEVVLDEDFIREDYRPHNWESPSSTHSPDVSPNARYPPDSWAQHRRDAPPSEASRGSPTWKGKGDRR